MSDTLAEALAELQASLPHIPKAARGQHGKYADLADLTRLIMPRLAELGLVWITKPTLSMDFGPEPKFVLAYYLGHVASEDEVTGSYPLGTGNPQQLGSAITYARRYCLCAVTGVAPDEDDDDGQAAVDELRALRRAAPEVDEHGAATVAEQTRMMTGPEPDSWRSNSTAENDPFYDQPPNERDYDSPATIGRGQQRAMHAEFAKLGIKDRAERLRVTVALLDDYDLKALGSSSDLSYRQAGDLLERLRAAGEGDGVAAMAVEAARRRVTA